MLTRLTKIEKRLYANNQFIILIDNRKLELLEEIKFLSAIIYNYIKNNIEY